MKTQYKAVVAAIILYMVFFKAEHRVLGQLKDLLNDKSSLNAQLTNLL